MSNIIGLARRQMRIWRVAINNRRSSNSVLGDFDGAVSVTSFGSRIAGCALAIESIAMGDVRPKEFILWLQSNLEGAPLPPAISRLARRGLSVRYVPDIKSHKKYFYSLGGCLASGRPLITIDDDYLYPPWFLAQIEGLARESSGSVFCYRAREMVFSNPGIPAPYVSWPFATTGTPSSRLFFTSGGGALLPRRLLEALAEQGDRFLHCCPNADDVWLNYIASRSRVQKRLVLGRSTDFTPLESGALQPLWAANQQGGNDRQLLATYEAELLSQLHSME